MDIVKGINCTVISAIHDLNIAAMYCDQLYVVQKGQIIASGTPKEVLTPALIRQVYEVEASVSTDEWGIPRILYRPLAGKEQE